MKIHLHNHWIISNNYQTNLLKIAEDTTGKMWKNSFHIPYKTSMTIVLRFFNVLNENDDMSDDVTYFPGKFLVCSQVHQLMKEQNSIVLEETRSDSIHHTVHYIMRWWTQPNMIRIILCSKLMNLTVSKKTTLCFCCSVLIITSTSLSGLWWSLSAHNKRIQLDLAQFITNNKPSSTNPRDLLSKVDEPEHFQGNDVVVVVEIHFTSLSCIFLFSCYVREPMTKPLLSLD